MSHVDDGLIHAWLDGALLPGDPERAALEAHLAACDECRARVEAERIIRDRAADVLRTAAPDVTRVEPFEQMIAARRARAATGATADAAAKGAAAEPETVPGRVDHAVPVGEAPSRRRRGLIPLAWAASLMMAVTAGWFARQYLRPAVAEPGQAPTAAAVESDVAGGPALRQTVAPGEAPVVPAPGDARAIVPPGAAEDATDLVGRVSSAESAQKAKLEAEVGAAGEGVSGGTRRPPEETRRLADAMLRDETRARAQESAAPPAAAAFADAGAAAVLAVYREAGWETVTEGEAERRLGQPPARIAGLPIDSLQATTYGSGWLVRVVQRIGAGSATAEILQWPQALALDEVVVAENVAGGRTDARAGVERQAAASGVAADRPLPNRPAVRLTRSGYGLLLRADVSADSLDALAARIR